MILISFERTVGQLGIFVVFGIPWCIAKGSPGARWGLPAALPQSRSQRGFWMGCDPGGRGFSESDQGGAGTNRFWEREDNWAIWILVAFLSDSQRFLPFLVCSKDATWGVFVFGGCFAKRPFLWRHFQQGTCFSGGLPSQDTTWYGQ